MRAESHKRGLISILLVLTLVLSMTFAAVPVLAPAIISWPEGTMEVPPGENFTFTHRLRWDEAAPGYYIITISWDYGGDNSWHFTLVENRAYFDNGDPIVATASITDKMGKYTVQVAALAGDMRDGYFTVDITLRASGPDGSPHRGGEHPISYVAIRCYEAGQRAEYPAPVTIRVLARAVAVSISPGSRSGPPGETLSYTVTVTNTGDVADNYDLITSDNAGWSISLDNDRFEDVENGGSRSTTLSVTIPEDAPNCTRDNITVTVTGTGVENSASCMAHALILRGVELAISPSYQHGSPESVLEYIVTVSNTGNVNDNYDLSVSDNAGWEDNIWLDDNTLTVPASENRTITLHVRIPKNAVPCTEDNITVTATSQGDNTVENSASCTAHAVIILRGVELAISPSYQHGSPENVLEYTITVSNTGNVEDNYDLTVTDNENWGPTVMPALLTVLAGGNGVATLSVTIPSDVALGTEDNITVTATSRENAEISASDTCVACAARVIYPIHDAYVWNRYGDTNYNTNELKIGADDDNSLRAWLRFDLSDIPFGHRVESARLWLYFKDSVGFGALGGIEAHFSSDDSWLEDDITWNEQPPFDDTASDNIPGFTDIGWKSLTLTQDVMQELDGDENVSWCLKSPEITIDRDHNIAYSKEEYENVFRPYLEIVHVPFYGVSISILPPENSVGPGENVTFTVTVNNMGAFEDNYDLTVSDNKNWGPTVSPTPLTVPAGGNGVATLSITIPGNATPCTRDNIIVTATSQWDNAVKDNASCIAHAAIAPPNLLTPSDGTLTDNNTPTFEWENTSVADNYEIWVDNDPDFLSLESGFPDNTAENYVKAPGLADENYSWKVRAYLGADVSDFSEVWTFIIDTTPPAEPTLAWPVDGENISDNIPKLDWEDVEENTLPVLYQVFISDNSEFPHENRTSPWVENDNWVVDAALPEGVWYWLVCARDNVGNVGENSDARSFRVDVTPPGKPTLVSPGNDTTENVLAVTFNWSSVPPDISAPVTYHIQIDNEASFTSPYMHENTGRTENSYNYTFSVDGNYYWWVRARDDAGNYGEWADNFKLTVETIVMKVTVSISPESKSGAPGENVTFTVTVTNEGNVEDTYNLTATDSLGWGATVSPTSLTITTGASDNATLSVVVPLDADDEDLTIITIEVESTEDPEVAHDSEDVNAQATVSRGVEAPVSPGSKSGPPGETLIYTVVVRNTGNVADNYALTVSDNAGWGPTLSENLLENVQPSENETVTLSVTIPENASSGAKDKITVKATSKTDSTVSDSFSITAQAMAIGGVEVSISPESKSGPPGETLTYAVVVRNTGNVADNYALASIDNAGWSLTLSENLLEVPLGGSKTTTLSVTIPGDAAHSTRDNVTVTATSRVDNAVSDNDSSIAHAIIVRGVGVSISPGHKSDVPGATLTYTVTVTNTSNVEENYNLTISDNAGWGPTLSLSSLTVPAGDSRATILSVTIPSGAEHGERDDITVTATSTENAEVSASASCEAEVSVLIRFEVSISPGSGSGEPGTSLIYTVTVRNAGLIDDNYTLRAVGAAGWSVSIEPTSLMIAAGASDNATVSVVVPPDADEGTSMTVNVSVRSEEDPTVVETDTCRTIVTGAPEGHGVELPVPLAISVVLIGAAIIVPAYLLRGRRKKGARRSVLRDASFSA